MRKWITYLVLIICLMHTSVNSQVIVEYGTAGTFPLNNFKYEGYKSGLGHSLTVLSKPMPSYTNWGFQLGGNINYFWANRTKLEFNYGAPYNNRSEYKVRNRHAALSFKARLISKPNPVRFYFDLDLGGRAFISKARVNIDEYDQKVKKDTLLHTSGALFAGLSSGIQFRMNRFWYLNIYSRLDYGLKTDWLDLNSVKTIPEEKYYYQPDYANYQYKTTTTPVLWVGFSTTFYFGGDGSAKPERKSRTTNTYTPNNTTPAPPKRGTEIPPLPMPEINLPLPAPKPKKPTPKPKQPSTPPNLPMPKPTLPPR